MNGAGAAEARAAARGNRPRFRRLSCASAWPGGSHGSSQGADNVIDPYNDEIERASARATSKFAASLLVASIIVTALYLGREVFVPVALAILFSFILAPLVKAMRRLGAGRLLSVVAVVLGASAAAAVLVVVVTMQISELAADLPRYQITIENKMASLKRIKILGFTIDKATEALNKASRDRKSVV